MPGIPGLKLFKPLPCLIFQARILFRFLVKFYIKVIQVGNGISMMCIFTSPLFIGNNQLSELRAPIAQMIDSNTSITKGFIDMVNGVSYECRTEMVDGKVFGNIGEEKSTITVLPLPALLIP